MTTSTRTVPVPTALMLQLMQFLGTVPGSATPGEECHTLRQEIAALVFHALQLTPAQRTWLLRFKDEKRITFEAADKRVMIALDRLGLLDYDGEFFLSPAGELAAATLAGEASTP